MKALTWESGYLIEQQPLSCNTFFKWHKRTEVNEAGYKYSSIKSMKKKHPKYTIKQGDTLRSITQHFGLTEDVWIRYHNSMCRLDDIIKRHLPSHLEEIYLLPELWEKEMELNYVSTNDEMSIHKGIEGVRARSSEYKSVTDWMVYPQRANMNRAYWFRYIIEDDSTLTEVRYKILVRYLREETNETALYLIHRISDTYVNDQLPTLCIDELAYGAGKVFFPMVIELDRKMQWVSLRNYKQIKDKWFSSVRPYLKLRFGGEVGEQYLLKMDTTINQREKMEAIFKDDLFLRFYFGVFYHSYSQQFETKRILGFNTGSNLPVRFNVKCLLNKNLTREGYKEIIQAGTSLVNEVFEEQDGFSEDKMNYSARILLEVNTNYVREAKIEWSLEDIRQKTTLILYPSRQQCKDEFNIKIDKMNNNSGLLSGLFG